MTFEQLLDDVTRAPRDQPWMIPLLLKELVRLEQRVQNLEAAYLRRES